MLPNPLSPMPIGAQIMRATVNYTVGSGYDYNPLVNESYGSQIMGSIRSYNPPSTAPLYTIPEPPKPVDIYSPYKSDSYDVCKFSNF